MRDTLITPNPTDPHELAKGCYFTVYAYAEEQDPDYFLGLRNLVSTTSRRLKGVPLRCTGTPLPYLVAHHVDDEGLGYTIDTREAAVILITKQDAKALSEVDPGCSLLLRTPAGPMAYEDIESMAFPVDEEDEEENPPWM